MTDKNRFDEVVKLLRRADDNEIDILGSMLSKKLRNRASEATIGEEVVNIDLEYIHEPFEYRGLIIFNPFPKLDIIEQILELRNKGYHIVFVSARFKYEGAEDAVIKWFMETAHVPEAAAREFFYSSCLVPEAPFITNRDVCGSVESFLLTPLKLIAAS